MATATDVCGFCFKEPVFGFCENCNIPLGVNCFSNHTKITLFTGHIVLPLGNNITEKYVTVPKAKDILKQKCQKHETEPQSLYCGKHEATICGRCILADHITCKDQIVDLHTAKFDELKSNALLVTLNEIEGEINYLQVRVDGNCRLNDECRASSIAAIKEYRKRIDFRLNQLQFDAEQATEKKHKENMNSLVEVAQICKDVSLRIQERGKIIEELSKKKQERHLFVYSKKLALEIDEFRTAIKQANFKNHITQFTFKEHATLENALQKEILEIGTLQEGCDGSEEIVDDIHAKFTETPDNDYESCAEITQPKNAAFEYQPPGKMTVEDYNPLGLYPSRYCITCTYKFLDGQQSNGKTYKGITETAFLPYSDEGRNMCRMLKVAFRRKLLFTINSDGVIVYNGIEKWKCLRETKSEYARVTAQLKAKGFTLADIDTNDDLTGTLTVD